MAEPAKARIEPDPEPEREREPRRRGRGLPTIPLQYDDLAVHRECRDKQVVYRGLHPKRSEIYFKTLGDIDWEGLSSRKGELVREVGFDSRFEGGNLHYAVRVSEREYNLYLRVDTNTAGHRMWFFFKVANRRPGRLKFNLLRFPKYKSLYQRGLRPFVFSKKAFLATGARWEQQGEQLVYSEDTSPYLDRPAYVLSFEYDFQHDNDEVFMATMPPYSYSQMLRFIERVPARHETLCRSLGGLAVPLLTIPAEPLSNTFVLVSARIHPGEVPSSYVCQGLLEELMLEASAPLLERVTFVVVPMLNPDGVFVGNYRTGLLGLDLNRQFHQHDEDLLPETTSLKMLVERLQGEGGKVDFFLDLHGHSTRKDMFAYGPEWEHSLRFYKSKLLIQKLSDISPHF